MVLIIDRKRSIGEAAREIGVQEYVLRFWEKEFPDYIKPEKSENGRRYYFDKDIKVIYAIKKYLHDDGYTIKGLRNLLASDKVKLECENYRSNVINTEKNNFIEEKNAKNTVQNSVENTSFRANIKENLKAFKCQLNNFYEKLKKV